MINRLIDWRSRQRCGGDSASVEFLDCMEQSLTTLCGSEVAAWQREMTTKMIATTALDPECILNASRFVSSRLSAWEFLIGTILAQQQSIVRNRKCRARQTCPHWRLFPPKLGRVHGNPFPPFPLFRSLSSPPIPYPHSHSSFHGDLGYHPRQIFVYTDALRWVLVHFGY